MMLGWASLTDLESKRVVISALNVYVSRRMKLHVSPMFNGMRDRKWSPWFPVMVCAGLILYLSWEPHPASLFAIFPFHQGDKVGHILAYGFLTMVCFRAFSRCAFSWMARHVTIVTLVASAGFGLMCEGYQMYLPSRSIDGWDIVSNSIGSCLAVLLGRYDTEGMKKRPERTTKRPYAANPESTRANLP